MQDVSTLEMHDGKKRLGNIITVLIPARSYNIRCAWTSEKPLSAIELFAGKLLLVFDELLPSELQGYFGLSDREREVLIEDMLENRLISIKPNGALEAGSILRHRSNGDLNIDPMLVQYDERVEQVIFELLSMSVRAKSRMMFGLPEIPLPQDKKNLKTDIVLEAFNRQYRSYLELTRNAEHEKKRTHLYKIMGCDAKSTIQIAVDIEFSYEPSNSPEPKRTINSKEKVSAIKRRPLSYELESKIADYLGSKDLNMESVNFSDFCKLVNDNVLIDYAEEFDFDYSNWMRARENNKTGYGTPETRAIFGPIYLPENRKTIISWLRTRLKASDSINPKKAIWYTSDVPLWGANSDDISEFTRKFEETLSYGEEDNCSLTTLHLDIGEGSQWALKKEFSSKINHGVVVHGAVPFDRIEILFVPGILAVVQYHGQPNQGSCVTLPIGYLTVEDERLALIEKFVRKRLEHAERWQVAWSKYNTQDPRRLIPDLFADALEPN